MSNDTQSRPAPNAFQIVHRWVQRIHAILARWWEQPIGILVPLIALVILLFAPQSADMFAGMVGTGSAFGFAATAAILALSSWYWTRAALLARDGSDDASWMARASFRRNKTEKSLAEWSEEWAPRVAVVLAGVIAATPLMALMFGTTFARINAFYPLLASALGLLAVIMVYAFTVMRARLFGRSEQVLEDRGESIGNAGEKRWLLECTSVIAAAPFGRRWAFLFLALSIIGVAVVAFFPGLVDHVDAPIAALLALGFVTPLLVLALALVRDMVQFLITTCVLIVNRLVILIGNRSFEKLPWKKLWASCTARDVRGLTGTLGLFVLLGVIFTPWFFADQRGLYGIRKAAPLAEASEPTLDRRRPTIEEALDEWRRARLDAGHPSDRPMPAIIVAASGGASRAALWLIESMRLLDERTKQLANAPEGAFGRYLFAISAVSGGSLGAVTYLQELRQYPRTVETKSGPIVVGLDWDKAHEQIKNFQGSDLLVASISTYFLNDALGPIARVISWGLWQKWIADRGTALELAFERHWADQTRLGIPVDHAKSGLIQLWQGGPRGMPHLLLNGTDLASGRRLITSTIRFASEDDLFAGSDDLLMLLKHDVPASTAVTNSARFPFISPAGRFSTDGMSRQVVDGGYFENYGARTAAELADKIQRLWPRIRDEAGQPVAPIVPIIIIVSNDAEALRSPDEIQACRKENQEKDACRSIEDATVSCDAPASKPEDRSKPEERSEQAQRAESERGPRGGGYGPEGLAPLLGLNATRGAHGQDALHIVRRHHCPVGTQGIKRPEGDAVQQTVAGTDTLPRMIHIALPKPKGGESAPLNWVLSESAVNFLRSASEIDFNVRQAGVLRDTLQALLNGEPARSESSLVTDGGRKQGKDCSE